MPKKLMVHWFIIIFLEQIATSGVSTIFFGKITGLGCRSVSDSDFHIFQSAGLVTSKVDHWLPNDLYTVIRNPATQYNYHAFYGSNTHLLSLFLFWGKMQIVMGTWYSFYFV